MVQALEWGQTSLQRGAVFMLFAVVLANLLFRQVARRAGLTAGEMLVIYFMISVSVCVSGFGMLEFLINLLPAGSYYATLANHYDRCLHFVPAFLVPHDPQAIKAFYLGRTDMYQAYILRDWAMPTLVWSRFLVGLFWVTLCLSALLRRQWVKLATPFQTDILGSWTKAKDAEAERFARTARYALTFDKPQTQADAWRLDLGAVRDSTRVCLNGRPRGALIAKPFQIALSALKPTENVLEIEVTNVAANRIRDMDRRGQRWKIFREINFVGKNYQPFDASDWNASAQPGETKIKEIIMKFGFCAPAAQVAVVRATGYDYLEWALAPTLEPEQAEADILPPLQEELKGQTILPEAFNVFLPGDLKVVCEDVDEARQIRYLQAAFARVAAVGGKIVVFGSGRSRNVPEGFSRAEAERQIIAFLQRCGPLAAAQGVMVAIEPLNTGECNILTSVSEALEVAQTVNHPAIRVLSDLYHVAMEGQSFAETRAAGSWLQHVHVAGAEGRRAPNSQDVDYLAPYFRVLKEMNYGGRISVEGSVKDLPREAAEALETLHKAWEMA